MGFATHYLDTRLLAILTRRQLTAESGVLYGMFTPESKRESLNPKP